MSDEANRLEDSAREDDEVIQKLNFIESVVAKYREDVDASASSEQLPENREKLNQEVVARIIDPAMIEISSQQSQLKKSGVFLDKLRPFRNKNEEAEYERVIVNLRLRRQQTHIALRWILIILIIPLVIQILAKNLILEPFLGNYSNRNPIQI